MLFTTVLIFLNVGKILFHHAKVSICQFETSVFLVDKDLSLISQEGARAVTTLQVTACFTSSFALSVITAHASMLVTTYFTSIMLHLVRVMLLR